MGKKGKGYRRDEEEQPVKKKNMITEEQLMDKSHMDRTEFIPLLAKESLYEPFIFQEDSEIALKKIVSDLNYLLYVDFKNFWATILYNPSLKNCLSTCLSFLHRRWMNNYRYSKETEDEFSSNEDNLMNFKRVKDEGVYEYTEGLAQVVLVIYHRIVSFNVQNKELAELYKVSEEITRRYILDFPKLLQLAEIYGETNPDIIKYIIKMYSKTLPTFYQTLTTNILPFLLKRMDELLRRTKVITEREEYGVNYSYKRLNGRELSQGEEQLTKKVTILMEMVSFINIIKNIIKYFPSDCEDHCYFNSQIQFIFQNIFLQLEAAYKVWNYQQQQIKLLNMINYILKECIDYFVKFFDRCNDIIVLHNRKSSTFEAYVNSLERVFKQFGKRSTVGKKNQTRNLLMYKIIQKQFDVLKMAQNIYQQELDEQGEYFNLQYLKDFIIILESEFKEQYINEDEPRQDEIEEETQAPFADNADDFQEKDKVAKIEEQEKPNQKEEEIEEATKKPELDELETLVPKRLRSEDYYSKLYSDFSNKYYKGEYEDDYDDIVDYDKRPLFFQEQSSNSQNQGENERHLVSNASNLQHVYNLHNKAKINQDNARVHNVNKPKYERVNNDFSNTNKSQQVQKPKQKYVQKNQAQDVKTELKSPNQPEEKPLSIEQLQAEQRRGGQGYKKSGKSYNFKPKDKHQFTDKHRNTNKQKDFSGGNNKKYRQK